MGIFPLQMKVVVLWKATKESALSYCSMTNIIWHLLSNTLIQQKNIRLSDGLAKCNLDEKEKIFVGFSSHFLLI